MVDTEKDHSRGLKEHLNVNKNVKNLNNQNNFIVKECQIFSAEAYDQSKERATNQSNTNTNQKYVGHSLVKNKSFNLIPITNKRGTASCRANNINSVQGCNKNTLQYNADNNNADEVPVHDHTLYTTPLMASSIQKEDGDVGGLHYSHRDSSSEDDLAHQELSDGQGESSEYTDARSSLSAPVELLSEFLCAVMSRNYVVALKHCQLILKYEPNNATALEFFPLISQRLQQMQTSGREGTTSGDDDKGSDEGTMDSYSSLEDDDNEGDIDETRSTIDNKDDEDESDSDSEKIGDAEEISFEDSGRALLKSFTSLTLKDLEGMCNTDQLISPVDSNQEIPPFTTSPSTSSELSLVDSLISSTESDLTLENVL